jgi:hypothetical protein
MRRKNRRKTADDGRLGRSGRIDASAGRVDVGLEAGNGSGRSVAPNLDDGDLTVALERLEYSLHQLLYAALENFQRYIFEKTERAVSKLDDVTAKGGPVPHAAFRAIQAALTGKGVVWEMIKGAVSGMSWKGKLLLAVLVILSPVLLILLIVVLLLILVVWAVVAVVRAATKSDG